MWLISCVNRKANSVKKQSSDLGDTDKVHHLEMNIVLSNRHTHINCTWHILSIRFFIVIIAICQIDIETSSSKMEEIQQPADGFLEVIERLEENYENHVDTSNEDGPFIVNEDMRKL